MAKLKCDTHKLRIFAINGKFIHRSGFGTLCESPTATIGKNTLTREEIFLNGVGRPKREDE